MDVDVRPNFLADTKLKAGHDDVRQVVNVTSINGYPFGHFF